MSDIITTVLLLLIYTAAFVFLMFAQNKQEYKKYYTPAKTINSLGFIMVAFICAFRSDSSAFFYTLLPGFILCFSGDVILGWFTTSGKRKYFLLGLSSFLCGHIAFVIAMTTIQQFSVLDFIFPVMTIFITLLLTRLKHMVCGKMTPVVVIYSFFVSLLFSKSTHIMITYFSMRTFVFATGSLLFLISDIVIMFLYFYRRKTPAVANINLFTYYYGMFLLALSLLY